MSKLISYSEFERSPKIKIHRKDAILVHSTYSRFNRSRVKRMKQRNSTAGAHGNLVVRAVFSVPGDRLI